jgi:hypothetical protein
MDEQSGELQHECQCICKALSIVKRTFVKNDESAACILGYISRFLYMWFAHPSKKFAVLEDSPKHSDMTVKKFWVMNTISMIVDGKFSFCFYNFSRSSALTLSMRAKLLSFSNSVILIDFDSGQKNMLTPDGESGNIQKNSACHRQVMKEAPGLKFIFSNMNL